MASVSKRVILFFLLGCTFLGANAQINIDLRLNPPFTPFISDYVRPERIEDIHISIFNSSGKEQRLKFKFSVINAAKGIEISIKETTVPLNPMILNANEFKLVQLLDVSNLYGKLNQNNFNLKGADIQSLILDGTIPDGLYEVCVQAFDYDKPGFSSPLSANSPFGCFNFQINYTDPPTDIRLNNNLLQYSFGGTVPQIGVNKLLGQNFTVQFTSPALNFGSQNEYTLYVFDETTVNPTAQREAALQEAVKTIIPLIKKTSSVPFFSITPADIELDMNKNYFLLIEATDLNRQSLFKNKGFSTFKAFKLVDIQPVIIGAPSFNGITCNQEFNSTSKFTEIKWLNNLPEEFSATNIKNFETRLKIVRFNANVVPPTNILTSTLGEVLLDTTVLYPTQVALLSQFVIGKKFGNDEVNNRTKWVFAVQNKIIRSNPFTSHLQIANNGFAQCEVEFHTDAQNEIGPTLSLDYPLQGDTIPFMYAPLIFKKNTADTSYKVFFTEIKSNIEPFIARNYYFSDTLVDSLKYFYSLPNSLVLDPKLSYFKELDQSGLFTSIADNPIGSSAFLSQSKKDIVTQKHFFSSSSSLFLASNTKGKANLAHSLLLKSDGGNLGNDPNSALSICFNQPQKNVVWEARIGAYAHKNTGNTTVTNYVQQFEDNTLSANNDLSTANKKGYISAQGNYQVGMLVPIITQKLRGQQVDIKAIEINFKPSTAPQKLFPSDFPNGSANQFTNMMVAQQWNIEVSRNRFFDSLIMVKSGCIIRSYSLPGDKSTVLNDLYNERKETLTLTDTGKYYYRIAWSNPVNLDTTNPLHNAYFKQLEKTTPKANGVSAFYSGFGNMLRTNYQVSLTDSFVVADSSITTKDTLQCGMACAFSMAGINNTAASNHVRVNDVVDVGLFKMKIKTINTNATSGTGTIQCLLFPAPIAVTFNNVHFNADKRMIDGEIAANRRNDDAADKLASYIPDGNNSLLSGFKSAAVGQVNNQLHSNDTIEELYNYFNSPACLVLNTLVKQEVEMPFGLSKEVDNFPHTIAITDIVFTPTGAKFNAACILEMELGFITQYVGFGATDLCLTPQGTGISENGGALSILGDFKIIYGNFNTITLHGKTLDSTGSMNGNGTSIIWDCKGFKQIDLAVSLTLSRDMVVPTKNRKATSGRVTAKGFTTINSLNNWLLTVNFDSDFELKAFPGFTFRNSQTTFDFSSLANPENLVFPANYVGQRGNAWKGIYMKEFGLIFPNLFHEKDTLHDFIFNAQNVMIDEAGFTASIGIDNALTIDSGSLAGWPFSIQRAALNFVNNVPTTANFTGQIGVPVFEGLLNYNLAFNLDDATDNLRMNFSLLPSQTLNMPAWFARVNLLETSNIALNGFVNDPTTLRLVGNFDGNISLGAANIAGLKDVNFGTLPFEGLKLRTSFYSLDSFSLKLDKLGGLSMNRVMSDNPEPSGNVPANNIQNFSQTPQTAGGFPIGIADFGMDEMNGVCTFDLKPNEPGKRTGIKFKVIVNVVAGEGESGIGGNCKIGIYAKPDNTNGLWSFLPVGLNIDTVRINAKVSGIVEVVGGIVFISNDPIFGNGIGGVLMGKFEPGISVGISGLFGEINGMRYMMFGAKAEFPPIPIDFSANVLYANSFSGEFWLNMNRTPGSAADAAAGFQIGKSPSGASFLPDRRASFGFGAALGLTGPPGTPLFGDIGLYAQFSQFGGLSKLTFEGNLWMPINDKLNAPLFINGNATIDITNQKIIGSMTVLLNVANGTVRGRKDTMMSGLRFYQAGSVDLLLDIRNNYWHLKMGNPFITNGKMGVGFYAGNELLFEAGNYFMMGNKLPPNLPPMDPLLVDKLRQAKITIPTNRQESSAQKFAVLAGIDAKIPEKKIELGPFYLGVELQFAVDGILAPMSFNCNNRNGIGGMYLTSRAYAYANGALGMHVATPFYTGDIIAAELNAGMLLDAGLMNPYYFKGQFTANYSILGGLIEGSKRFDFELAEDEKCKPSNKSTASGFGQIVADATPAKNAADVLVGIEPVIALNFSLNEETKFKIPTKLPGTTTTVFIENRIRIKYENVKLYDHVNRYNRSIKLSISNDGFELRIRPDSFLRDKKTSYTLTATFYMERFNATANQWQKVMRTASKAWDTTISVAFITEDQATFQSNYIAFSTPREGENFFKKGDHSYGKLVFNQSDVKNTFFSSGIMTPAIIEIKGYNRYYGLFSSAGNPNDTISVGLNFTGNEVRFNLPNTLDPDKLYQFRIIKERVPPTGLANLPSTTFRDRIDFQQRVRTASTQSENRLIMHAFVFKVSKYNTLAQKIEQVTTAQLAYSFSTSAPINVILNTNEPFEEYEIEKDMIRGVNNVQIQASNVVVAGNSASNSDQSNWISDFYRPDVFTAGATLYAKKSYLTSPFIDFSKKTDGVVILINEHILEPIPNRTAVFDLRLADMQMVQLKSALSQMSQLRLQGVLVNNSLISQNSGLSLNNTTGMVSTGVVTGSGSTTSNTTTPAIGSQLHLSYPHFLMMYNDFNRLKTFANNIVISNPMGWMIGLTTAERNLVTAVRNSNYTFEMPKNSNKFVLGLHINSLTSTRLEKISINSNIIDISTLTIVKANTTFSGLTGAIK